MKNLFLLLLFIPQLFAFSIPTYSPTTKVTLHLEKFNEKYNLLHIGISFQREFKTLRYDYRAFCEDDGCTYETTDIDRMNPREVFPNADLLGNLEINDDIEQIDIYWGESNKTLDEIQDFEKTLHKKYILGINDCRHYVNKFTEWAMDKPTPIWKLYKLWDEYYKIDIYDIDEN